MSNQTNKNEGLDSIDVDQTKTNPCANDEQFLNRLAIQHKVLTELVKTKKTNPGQQHRINSKGEKK